MTTFNSPAQLEVYLREAIDSVIKNEVFNVIRKEWLETQNERVYSVYEPKKYRRRDTNGLSDPSNIILHPPNNSAVMVEYVMENIAKGNGWDEWNGKLINDMIEGSTGFAGDPANGMPARPYTEETVANLTSGIARDTIKQAIFDGMKKHGISITIN